MAMTDNSSNGEKNDHLKVDVSNTTEAKVVSPFKNGQGIKKWTSGPHLSEFKVSHLFLIGV